LGKTGQKKQLSDYIKIGTDTIFSFRKIVSVPIFSFADANIEPRLCSRYSIFYYCNGLKRGSQDEFVEKKSSPIIS